MTVDIVTTEGELGVKQNMQRKAAAADKMFDQLVAEMTNSLKLDRTVSRPALVETPSWL